MDQGRLAKARELFDQALLIHREVKNGTSEGYVLSRLAKLERLMSSDLELADRAVVGTDVSVIGE